MLGAVEHYGMALQLGQKHVYQALPRLLAMWLEFTSLEEDDASPDKKGKSSKFISKFLFIIVSLL